MAGSGVFRRQQWRRCVEAYEQPGGSRDLVFGAKGRGRRGLFMGSIGSLKDAVNREESRPTFPSILGHGNWAQVEER